MANPTKSVFSGSNQPGYHGPGQVGPCPFAFTGNAHDEWQDFFTAAWQFGQWASTEDVSGCGPSIAMQEIKVIGHEPDGKPTTDGITLSLAGAGWAADVFMHFTELLQALPNGYPDGDLEIHVGSLHNDRVVLHLWHD